MDSYQLIAKDDQSRLLQVQGMIRAIKLLKQRYPKARIVFNRGFEMLKELSPLVEAVAAESFFQSWNHRAKAYQEVPEQDRQWLLARMAEARALGLKTIAIDYVDPTNSALSRQSVARLMEVQMIPYVSDGLLLTVGRGRHELVRRKVVLIHDSTIEGDPHFSHAYRFLTLPLQYLGYRVDTFDMRSDSAPREQALDEYAALIVLMSSADSLRKFDLQKYLRLAQKNGLKLIFFDGLNELLDEGLTSLLKLTRVRAKLQVPFCLARTKADLIPYEIPPLAIGPEGTGFRLKGPGESYLQIQDNRGETFDAAGIAPWGGWALFRHIFVSARNGEMNRWAIDPTAFLERAIAAPSIPIPDVTTEAGRRLLLMHIDGDGFASRAEILSQPLAAEVLQKDFIMRYNLPHTVSVIQGEVAANGLYPALSPTLEKIARNIFALDNVEIATHSRSHLFYWVKAMAEPANQKLRLALPDYQFDLDTEIGGSADYINERPAPPGKRTKVMLWAGPF